jgi:hypothetical protein
MKRRHFVAAVVSAPLMARARPVVAATASRARPGDPAWPSAAAWDRLRKQVGGRLTEVQSPLGICRDAPTGIPCRDFFRALKNPYYIGDDVALTQTTGWVDAWTSQPSAYAVAADTAQDVAAAVNFARDNNLRLVVKGGGHSYLGTSNAPDSLLIWTRRMNAILLHDAFVPQGCDAQVAAQPAVSLGAGAIWMHAYNAVTTKGGRYVQGGGCGTVGVAGLVLGGGFGSYSKHYGLAAASLLEAEIVTADGAVRIANACTEPDLFWALKGGGGGTFGVVTRLTLRTHELPQVFGFVSASIHAASDRAFRGLIGRFVDFYADSLMNPHWGEIVNIRAGRRLDINMASHGLDDQQAEAIWQPFLRWVAEPGNACSFLAPPVIRSGPARNRWDPVFLKAHLPGAVLTDGRPGASEDNIYWAANLSEAGHFIHGYESLWLPASLLQAEQRARLADALFEAGRIWSIELHFQKGLAGASADTLREAAETATNPVVRDAFVLAIIASEGPPAFPDVPGYLPDLVGARHDAVQIGNAVDVLRSVAPGPGAYVAESSYFQADWQHAYWGANYPRLLEIKRRYDPSGVFFAHHGVGSEDWSADGFTRVAER